MRELVAIDLPGGPEFVVVLQRIWDRGDTALPVDQRLPQPARQALIESMEVAAVIGPQGEQRLAAGRPTDDGDALVVATSGSTGVPKGVVLTHAAVAASAEATSEYLDIDADSHWLACLPLAHVGGLSVVTRAMHMSTQLTVLPGFDADAVTAAAHAGATHTSLVATALGRIDAAIFQRIVLGGSRPPADRPANCVTTYGMTETGSGVVYDGRPLRDVEIDIAADDEILIRCPMMLRTYRDGSTPVDNDGWLHTDDLGRWLDDGRLYVDGRRGDVIVTGGEKVWPEVVEQVLTSHPAVADAVVAGVTDVEWGEAVRAWIVPIDTTVTPSLDELREWVRAVLPAYMAPKSLIISTVVPRTALGKIRRSEFRTPPSPSL